LAAPARKNKPPRNSARYVANRDESWRQLTPVMFYSFPPAMQENASMQQTSHYSALEAKHAVLDRQIADESHRPMPDPVALAALKKQKLRIKEEMVAL
jgi:hypothetical protein